MSFDTLVNIAIFAVALLLMVRFGFGLHLLGRVHSHAHAGAPGGSVGGPLIVDQTFDPVCGMSVDRPTAITSSFAGRTYAFCSESCRKKFEASPASYSTRAVPTPRQAHHHGCCG